MWKKWKKHLGNGAQFWIYVLPQNETLNYVTKWLLVIEQGDWAGFTDSENPKKKLHAPNLSDIFKVTVIASCPSLCLITYNLKASRPCQK